MSAFSKLNILMLVVLNVLLFSILKFGLAFWWIVLMVLLYMIVVAYGSFVLSAQFFLPVRYRGDGSEKKIAITFDDGPVAGFTERILGILDAANAPAAFFCIGSRAVANENLMLKIHQGGHLVGNHTYSHKPNFGFLSQKEVSDELATTDQVIKKIIKKTPRLFRPPFGVTNPMVASAIKIGSYKTISWSVRSFDTIIKNPDRLFKRITKSITSGDIVLFHDYCESTIQVLPRFIEFVRSKGFEIVRLDELLNEKAYQ